MGANRTPAAFLAAAVAVLPRRHLQASTAVWQVPPTSRSATLRALLRSARCSWRSNSQCQSWCSKWTVTCLLSPASACPLTTTVGKRFTDPLWTVLSRTGASRLSRAQRKRRELQSVAVVGHQVRRRPTKCGAVTTMAVGSLVTNGACTFAGRSSTLSEILAGGARTIRPAKMRSWRVSTELGWC